MQFRVRPSSKRSNNNELSLVEFPTSKSLMSADSPLPRSLGARIQQLESALNSFQESHKRERQVSNAGYVEVQRRLDKVEYKIFGAQQELRQLSQIRQLKQPRQIVASFGSEPSKNELILMKQVLMQEKQAQRDLAKYQNTQIEQLNNKLLRQQQEIRQLIAQQRVHWEQRMSGQEEQLREVEGLKSRKMQQQYELMRGVIANAERKIYEELERKIRNEAVIKDFVEERIFQVKQELTSQHRQTLASETKFIKETKLSLETLFSLINSTKKDLGEQLNQTQKLTTGSIKKLSNALEIFRQKATGEVKEALEMHKQVADELIELRNFVTTRLEENRQIMNEFEEQTNDRLQHGGGGNHSRVGPGVDDEKISLFQKEMNHWKSITEQKNLNVFKEISNTLKAMKLEWRKQNDEMVSEVASLNQSLKSVKKQGPAELKKSVQALVSIFNSQFDVLAEELQTLTDMIALAKRENEKKFKQELVKLKGQFSSEIVAAVAQKAKQSAQYSDRLVNRSEQNMKNYVVKEIKFASESLSQRIEKNQNGLSQMDTSLKKANLLTNSQLEDYSLKLKNFNDSYKDYLEEQRKEDMKKRMDLEQSMRKNASSLMDICYKKCQFLVDGLKSNIEMSQMKQKVEAAQALESAKDELKKQVQGARQEWQKQLSQGLEKLTKERETALQMMQQTVDQAINNAKRNLTNQIGNSKLELEEKLNQMRTKNTEMEAEQEERHIDLKNTVLNMLRDQKKLNQQNNNKTKQQVETRLAALEQKIGDKQAQTKNRQQAQRSQIQNIISAQIKKVEATNQQAINFTKKELQMNLTAFKQETKVKFAQLEGDTKKVSQQKAKAEEQNKSRQAQLQQQIKSTNQTFLTKIAELNTQIEQINKKMGENQDKAEKQKVASTAELTERLNQLEKKQAETSDKLVIITQDLGKMSEGSANKIEELKKQLAQYQQNTDKKMGQNQDKVEKEKVASTSELTERQKELDSKQVETDKKIVILTQDLQKMNQDSITKIQELNKKIVEYQNNTEKEGEDKKVGEDRLNQMKKELDKKISNLEAKVDELEAKDKGQDNEQAIANVRKSVNKLEAMVFSEQAKNKTMYDRLTEDVNKVSESLTILTNQMRQ